MSHIELTGEMYPDRTVSITGDVDPERLQTLSAANWPRTAYDRDRLLERVLQFGTGMLLRAMPAAFMDSANRAGAEAGRIVVVQSTRSGNAGVLTAQSGLFTLVERGFEDGRPVQRTRLVGSIARALVAERDWSELLAIAASPELRAVVSNVTEAGFRLEKEDTAGARDANPSVGERAPAGFPEKLAALLHERFHQLGAAAPQLLVIPTELVDDNGPRLAAMVSSAATSFHDRVAFRLWLREHVVFSSSLVDRITTGAPKPGEREEMEQGIGYRDALLTIAEPQYLWAIEGNPEALRAILPIDTANPGVVFTPSIAYFRERKIRLLNGAHTAFAPLATLAGIATVRDAVEHGLAGAFIRALLFDEIVPSMDLPAEEMETFAEEVLDRFRNPWLHHEWRTIATNQTAKVRVRVVPSVLGFAEKRKAIPPRLTLALAAYLRYMRPADQESSGVGGGWWRGQSYPIDDADRSLVARHWSVADGGLSPERVQSEALVKLAASVLGDTEVWGADLSAIVGLDAAVIAWLHVLESDGADVALRIANIGALPGSVATGVRE